MTQAIKIGNMGGGLNSAVLAKMNSGIAILTSYNVAEIVVLPYALDEMVAKDAVKKYLSADTFYESEDLLKVARLHSDVITIVKIHKVVIVYRGKLRVAVLLPATYKQERRKEYAQLYLQTLGYEHISLPAL